MKMSVGSNEVDSFPISSPSTPSTPVGQGPLSLGGPDWTDEPIHIINVSLQYENLEGLSDDQMTKKSYQFAQVTSGQLYVIM